MATASSSFSFNGCSFCLAIFLRCSCCVSKETEVGVREGVGEVREAVKDIARERELDGEVKVREVGRSGGEKRGEGKGRGRRGGSGGSVERARTEDAVVAEDLVGMKAVAR